MSKVVSAINRMLCALHNHDWKWRQAKIVGWNHCGYFIDPDGKKQDIYVANTECVCRRCGETTISYGSI